MLSVVISGYFSFRNYRKSIQEWLMAIRISDRKSQKLHDELPDRESGKQNT